jgi:phosphodiesterase/alkaline phosphatase D-like protein
VFEGDMGYANNRYHSCYLAEEDYFADRFTRFLADPRFVALRRRTPVGFIMDDHDYGPRNNADRTTVKPWTYHLWNRMHADPSTDGYFDFRIGDVHCITLDGRRYADPVWYPNRPGKTKLGPRQFAWMQSILESSDAGLFVVFSADTFASRYLRPGSTVIPDCFIGGWPGEYERAMTVFGRVQAGGRRVVILSGDAHSLRIHYHPPGGPVRPGAPAVVEFVCSGLRPRHWFGAAPGDPTLDPLRNVLGHAGGGMLTVDPASATTRTVALRAISGERAGPTDLFPPLVVPFRPTGPPAPAVPG